MKNLKLALFAVMLPLLVSCSSGADKLVKVDLGPIPYSIEVPGEIAEQLFVENMVTSTPNEYTRQVKGLERDDGSLRVAVKAGVLVIAVRSTRSNRECGVEHWQRVKPCDDQPGAHGLHVWKLPSLSKECHPCSPVSLPFRRS